MTEDEEVKHTLAGCFPDFRHRTTSFDLHNIGNHQKMSLINKLFRSRSDGSIKTGRSPRNSPSGTPKNSPNTSPGNSPAQGQRRRFVRVVKNNEAHGEEYVNPHVIRKYSRGFIETRYMTKSASLEEHDRPLPYKVTGHTILKKHHSEETHKPTCKHHAHHSADGLNKHASFNEDVEIVQFDRKGKCVYILDECCIKHERLQDELDYNSDSSFSENLTDQDIPESEEEYDQENIPTDCTCNTHTTTSTDDKDTQKDPTVFNLDQVTGEESTSPEPTPVIQNSSDDSTKVKSSSPKLVKQNSDEGLPAPKKSKFGRSGSLDSVDRNSVTRDFLCSDCDTKDVSHDQKKYNKVQIES